MDNENATHAPPSEPKDESTIENGGRIVKENASTGPECFKSTIQEVLFVCNNLRYRLKCAIELPLTALTGLHRYHGDRHVFFFDWNSDCHFFIHRAGSTHDYGRSYLARIRNVLEQRRVPLVLWQSG